MEQIKKRMLLFVMGLMLVPLLSLAGGKTAYATEKVTIIFDVNTVNNVYNSYAELIGTSKFSTGHPGERLGNYIDALPEVKGGGSFYQFEGWYTAPTGGEKVTLETLVTNDATYYAHWKIIGAWITFDCNGGWFAKEWAGCEDPEYTSTFSDYQIGETITDIPIATRSGYIFLGWYTSPTGGSKIADPLKVTGNATYYAHWKNTVLVTFDCNGGWFTGWWVGNQPDTGYTTSGMDYTIGFTFDELPAAGRRGYTFSGWYPSKTGGSRLTEPYVVTADVTYYARWTAVMVGKGQVKSMTAGGNTLSVDIGKVSGANGYEVQYSTNKNMKNAKIVTTSDNTVLLKNLKGGKKYYIRLRAYKLDSTDKKVYGTYSAVKSKRTTIAGLSITKKKLLAGQTLSLKLKGASGKIVWSSNKKSVATVNKKGKVTAKKKGKAVITARYEGKKYKCTVTVEKPKLNKSSISLVLGDTSTVKLTGTTYKVTYSSSNPKIAKVNNQGKITPVAEGTTTIKAKANEKTYKCTVKVNTVKVTTQMVKCTTCGGAGTVKCGVCGGAGSVTERRYDIYSKTYVKKTIKCNVCSNGRVTCPTCHGNKYIKK